MNIAWWHRFSAPTGPRLTSPDQAAGLIDHLREQGLTLSYDPRDRTLRTGASDPVALTV
jgi:hypothetical protein